MTIDRNTILLIVWLIVSGCTAKPNYTFNRFVQQNSSDPIHIIVDSESEIETSYNVSLAFDSVSFVQLSNEPEAIVTNIDEILVKDSLIVVLDRYGRGVKLFSMTGRFLGNVGNRGRGPGEYVESTNMEFFEDKIVVWDQYSQKLLYYGFDTKFLGEHNIERYSLKFHQFDDNCIMFNSVNNDNVRSIKDYTLFTCDTLSNVVSVGMFRKKNSYYSLWVNHNFFTVDSLVYYHPVYCDSIYSISSDSTIKPEYYIDFGDFTAPEKYRNNSIKDSEFQEVKGSGKYSFFDGDFYLTDNYL